MSGERLHNMKSVERRTGLGASVIRVWERRYGAVKPQRAGNLRRLYTEEEVERLTLLGRLTQAGLAIGQIATLPLENLRAMQSDAERENRVVANAGGDADLEEEIREAIATIVRDDPESKSEVKK